MPFGLGALELLVLLAILALPVGGLALLAKAIAGVSRSARQLRSTDRRQLAAELDAAQSRLHELEAKLARSEEKSAFTQAPLEGRGPGTSPEN